MCSHAETKILVDLIFVALDLSCREGGYRLGFEKFWDNKFPSLFFDKGGPLCMKKKSSRNEKKSVCIIVVYLFGLITNNIKIFFKIAYLRILQAYLCKKISQISAEFFLQLCFKFIAEHFKPIKKF